MNNRGSSRSEFLCSLFDFDFLRCDKFLNVCTKSNTYNHGIDTDIDKYEWLDNVDRAASTRHLCSTFGPCRGSNTSRIDLPWVNPSDSFIGTFMYTSHDHAA